MSSVEQSIIDTLAEALSPDVLQVENESHGHNVPRGSETHFKVTLVTPEFAGLSAVKRHQKVYQLLQDQLAAGVHALALHLFTPEEWQARGGVSQKSPPCMGGSKK